MGRRPQCALQLRGSRVSAYHCALYWDQRRLWCIDLLSSNGTQLNGAKIDFAEIQLNDRIDVGEFGLVYFRWSPRRSMQPGWQPAAGGDEHDLAEAHDSAAVLDAALPPPAAAADLALAADLANSGGSGAARDADGRAATELHLPSASAAAEQEIALLREQLAVLRAAEDALPRNGASMRQRASRRTQSGRRSPSDWPRRK